MNRLKFAATLVATSFLMAACGGGGDDGPIPGPGPAPAPSPGPSPAPPPSASPQILSVSGTDTAGFGTELDLREFAYGREDLTGAVESLVSTSQGVLATLIGGGTPTAPPEPVVVIVTTPFAVSMRINTNDGTRSWRYAVACFNGAATAPCPGITFDRANRRVTFDNQIVLAASGSDNLATAPIRLSGSLNWVEEDE